MVLVPEGTFWRGCAPNDTDCGIDERPGHVVRLDAFHIDKTEVTVAAYRSCVDANHCSAPDTGAYCNWGKRGRANHPINCVDHMQASTYCAYRGKRLPTEAEWEKAARGTDGRVYPWGDAPPTCALAIKREGGNGCGRDSTWPVGSKPAGASPYGALDMAGNVSEWIARAISRDYLHTARRNPTGPSGGDSRGDRGGSWVGGGPRSEREPLVYGINYLAPSLRASERAGDSRDQRARHRGFRCARSAE